MRKYDSYKSSGVEWIGEIPSHWATKRLKFLAKVKTGYTPLTSKQDNFCEDGVVWAKPDDLNTYNPINSSRERISTKGLKLENLVPKGSVLVCCIGSIGKFGVAGVDLVTNQQINSLSFNELIYSEFGKYLVGASQEEHDKKASGNVVKILNATSQKEIFLPVPSLPEQTAIATFLDQKTAQIDRAIAQKERLIELLRERKQIVIQQAVTRGLDPTVKMKDSGVEWIGRIPEHWEVKKLKFVFSISGGGTPSKENSKYWNGNIPWVSPKDMKFDYIIDTIDKVTQAGIDNSPLSILPVNSLLLVVRSGILQHTLPVAITKVSVTVNQDIKAFRSSAFMLADYLMYFIRGNNSTLLNNWVKTGATVESVEVEQMMNDTILVPPLTDQQNIVEFIDAQSLKIDRSIDLHLQQIAKLKEYRTVLIDAAVTGKVRVS